MARELGPSEDDGDLLFREIGRDRLKFWMVGKFIGFYFSGQESHVDHHRDRQTVLRGLQAGKGWKSAGRIAHPKQASQRNRNRWRTFTRLKLIPTG